MCDIRNLRLGIASASPIRAAVYPWNSALIVTQVILHEMERRDVTDSSGGAILIAAV